MADKLTPERRSVNMSRIRSGEMLPEMNVRRLVHALGYRYRLHGASKSSKLPGKPDLVFASKRKVIFVHGCFWHQHDNKTCKITRQPKSNNGYWQPKLARNVERDSQSLKALNAEGWRVLTIWECEISDTDTLSKRLQAFLR